LFLFFATTAHAARTRLQPPFSPTTLSLSLPAHLQPLSTAALLSAAARALVDASTGRYLYRQARAAVRAVSASPSPGPASRPRSRRASESSPERGGGGGEEAHHAPAMRRRRASMSEGLPPLPPLGGRARAGGSVRTSSGATAADGPLTRSRSGGLR
jgi:hypothetical protein